MEKYNSPKWTRTKEYITIKLPIAFALFLAEELNLWKSQQGWTKRSDCRNWKRSLPARENRRESIVYGNCLETIKAILGRREMLALMAEVAEAEE